MVNQQFISAFSHLHASDNTLQKVLAKANTCHKTPRFGRRFVLIAAIIALLCGMVTIAHATGLLGDIWAVLHPADNGGEALSQVYGDFISTDNSHMADHQGNPIQMPDMERITLEWAQAEQISGDYIHSVDASFTIRNNTFTLCNFMIDENGIGMLTWTVENPNGIDYQSTGYGAVDFFSFNNPIMTHIRKNGTRAYCSCYNYLIESKNDGRTLKIVSFFASFDQYEPGESLLLEVLGTSIQIEPIHYTPVKIFESSSGIIATLSSQGLAIHNNANQERICESVILNFRDGQQKVIKGKQTNNLSGSLWRKAGTYTYGKILFIFNTLIDPQQVSSIQVRWRWVVSEEHSDGSYENIFYEEELLFLP